MGEAMYPYPQIPYSEESILLNAPEASGVAAIFNDERPIIVVQDNRNLKLKLWSLFHDGDGVRPWRPKGVYIETCPSQWCIGRQNQLIAQLQPVTQV
jgi:hypothetical protein